MVFSSCEGLSSVRRCYDWSVGLRGKMTEILEQGHIFFAFHEQVKFRTTSMSYFFSFFFLSETRQVKG